MNDIKGLTGETMKMCVGDNSESATDKKELTIPEYFAGKCILITGATGFLGKILIEKLLRCCPKVHTIYILIRPKKGKSMNERFQQILDSSLYDRLRKEQPDLNYVNKVIPIAGDAAEINLGLSNEDRKLLIENINIIYHIAATVRFDEPLKSTILLNIRGTREICQLALDSKRLEVFMHVSTAYVNCNREISEEIIYETKSDWRKVISTAENLDNYTLSILENKYIDMPNTYTFSKKLAEHVVKDMCSGKIATKIFRPSIVIGALYEDPVIGWVDNFNGPMGIVAGFGKGILRTIFANNSRIDFIPIDISTKSLIVATWDLAIRQNTVFPEVIHCTSNHVNWLRLSTVELTNYVQLFSEIPFNNIFWIPSTHSTNYPIIFYIRFILFMIIPSIFGDMILKLIGQKPRLVMVEKKMYVGLKTLTHFLNNEFTYINDNLFKLLAKVHLSDKEDWDYDFRNCNLIEYIKNCKLGIRRYLLHESDDTIPKAIVHYNRLYWIDIIVKVLVSTLGILILWKIVSYKIF